MENSLTIVDIFALLSYFTLVIGFGIWVRIRLSNSRD